MEFTVCCHQCITNHSDVQILDKKNIAKESREQRRKELEDQHWYHGLLSREDIESVYILTL